MSRIRSLLVFSFLFLAHCATGPVSPAPRDIQRAPASEQKISKEFLERLPKSASDYVLKFSVLRNEKGEFSLVFIQDPQKYEFHYQYLQTRPEFAGLDRKQIEALTFKSSPDRRAWIGVVILNQTMIDSDYEDLQYRSMFYIMSEEAPEAKLAQNVMLALREKFDPEASDEFGIAKLGMRPLPEQEAAIRARADEFRSAGVWIRYRKDVARVVYSDGWGVGKLVLAEKEDDLTNAIRSGRVGPESIVVLGQAPRELPPVAGVISAVPLTPGSHLSLLAQMYAMPLVFEKSALTNYANHDGKWVLLSSLLKEESDFDFLPGLTSDEVRTLQSARRHPTLEIPYNDGEKTIAETEKLQAAAVSAFGGKAVKFGLLRRTISASVRPMSAGIPIYYYRQFLKQARLADGRELQVAVDQLLREAPAGASYSQVEQTALKIRDTIKSVQVPPGLVSDIRKELVAIFKPAENTELRLRLRSSSNVEDGAEFNGAGLYESEGVCLANCKKDDFERGLNKVWRSLFTSRGLWARRQFQVPDDRVGMGLLAHAPFKGELFNGVARATEKIVTRSEFERIGNDFVEKKTDTKQIVFEIVTQRGEDDSVTNASNAVSAEVVTIDPNKTFNIVRPMKGLADGRAAMSSRHYSSLVSLLKKLVEAWPKEGSSLIDIEIEIEWKVAPENNSEKVFVKQVRQVPHPVTFSLPDSSNQYFATGGRVRWFSAYPSRDVIEGLYHISRIDVDLAPFTSQDAKAGRINVKGGTMIVRGQAHALKLSAKPQLKMGRNYSYLSIPFTSRLFPLVTLELEFLPESGGAPVVVPARLQSSYRVMGFGPKELTGRLRNEHATIRETWIDDRAPQTYVFKGDPAACKILMTAKKTHVVEQYDSKSFIFNSIQVSGLLARPIVVKGETNYFLYRAVHEGMNSLAVDLFADPSLSATDRQSLNLKFGRYLTGQTENGWTELPDGKMVESTEWKLRPRLIRDDFRPGRAPAGCLSPKQEPEPEG